MDVKDADDGGTELEDVPLTDEATHKAPSVHQVEKSKIMCYCARALEYVITLKPKAVPSMCSRCALLKRGLTRILHGKHTFLRPTDISSTFRIKYFSISLLLRWMDYSVERRAGSHEVASWSQCMGDILPWPMTC